MKKSLLVLVLCVCAMGFLFANGAAESGTPSSAKPLTLKISISETTTDIKAGVLKDMIKEIEEKSNGSMKFELYCSNELGSLGDVVEQTKIGANIISGTSGDFYANYGAPDILATSLPYVLSTMDQVDKLDGSDLFKKWSDAIQKQSGLKLLCMNWSSSPRDVISSKPIKSVADFKGLKIRVPGLSMDAFFTNLGASTMTMAFSDVYTSMQQGMVDAAEAGLSGLYGFSIQEVGKNVYQSEHSLAPAVWSMSGKIWDSMSAENQKILVDAFRKYGRIYSEKGFASQDSYIEKMKAAGVTFVKPSDADKQAMQKAAFATFDAFPELSKDLADQISAIIK